jgi:hypothetical protein
MSIERARDMSCLVIPPALGNVCQKKTAVNDQPIGIIQVF